MSKWQSIETAPKDGTRILLFFPKINRCNQRQEFGQWEEQKYHKNPKPYWSGDWEPIFGIRHYMSNPPTHWMPQLPPPENE
jgi:hypothetical protein